MARNNKNARRVLPKQEPLWEQLYHRFLRKVNCPETAAELLQQLRLQVLKWTQENGEPENPEHFSKVAAHSVFIDWLRSGYRRVDAISLDDDRALEASDESPSPEALLADADWQAAVREELAKVTESPLQRAILAEWDEPLESIAERFDSTAAAVGTYRNKLRKRLRLNARLASLFADTVT
jgi:DNA-directed RNA polymerase specialized sigma24 family protein